MFHLPKLDVDGSTQVGHSFRHRWSPPEVPVVLRADPGTGGYNVANRGRPSMNKRRKEEERRQWQQKKVERRAERVANRPESAAGEDADIAGIIPGPQPPRDD
jgi:hypothetical protein